MRTLTAHIFRILVKNLKYSIYKNTCQGGSLVMKKIRQYLDKSVLIARSNERCSPGFQVIVGGAVT
jgi:hypothetical protein